MKAEQFLRDGRLEAAIQELGVRLRDHPEDRKSRTFLFELLCFNGDFDRAEKHLSFLGDENKEAAMGALVYHSALHAERLRRKMFENGEWPPPLPEEDSRFQGTWNGKPFQSLVDSDPRVGPRLEIYAGGDYMWIPLRHVRHMVMQPPARLRDLLWIPAKLITGPALKDFELGEVMLPALAPLSYTHPDETVRLGRLTEWCADEAGNEAPYGLKTLLVDGEETPLLELRTLEVGEAEG